MRQNAFAPTSNAQLIEWIRTNTSVSYDASFDARIPLAQFSLSPLQQQIVVFVVLGDIFIHHLVVQFLGFLRKGWLSGRMIFV